MINQKGNLNTRGTLLGPIGKADESEMILSKSMLGELQRTTKSHRGQNFDSGARRQSQIIIDEEALNSPGIDDEE